MKKGRPHWSSKVSRPALERLHAAIAAGEEPRGIFDRFNVQQYGISPRTFRRYYDWRRRDWEERQEPAPQARQTTTEDLLQSCLESVQLSLDAGRRIDSGAVNAIQACVATLKLDINREAEKRASDKHEAWKAETARKQTAALEAVTSTAQLTPEQVKEIRLKVLGL